MKLQTTMSELGLIFLNLNHEKLSYTGYWVNVYWSLKKPIVKSTNFQIIIFSSGFWLLAFGLRLLSYWVTELLVIWLVPFSILHFQLLKSIIKFSNHLITKSSNSISAFQLLTTLYPVLSTNSQITKSPNHQIPFSIINSQIPCTLYLISAFGSGPLVIA
jgi:hypothetical protein